MQADAAQAGHIALTLEKSDPAGKSADVAIYDSHEKAKEAVPGLQKSFIDIAHALPDEVGNTKASLGIVTTVSFVLCVAYRLLVPPSLKRTLLMADRRALA